MTKTSSIIGVVAAATAGLLLGARPGEAQEASRYPYDPVCPWGRLSNGKGMLVRCISQPEASTLRATSGPGAPAAPSANPGTPPAPSASAAPEPPPAAPAPAGDPKSYSLRAITVTADEGKLPAASKKLGQAKDKLVECVAKNGGLERVEGEAHVRFLVRAAGRAEGVSVQKRSGMSAAAAECIAHVIDRRWVGTPESPMVGAVAVVRVALQK